jgi:hypothetical protein
MKGTMVPDRVFHASLDGAVIVEANADFIATRLRTPDGDADPAVTVFADDGSFRVGGLPDLGACVGKRIARTEARLYSRKTPGRDSAPIVTVSTFTPRVGDVYGVVWVLEGDAYVYSVDPETAGPAWEIGGTWLAGCGEPWASRVVGANPCERPSERPAVEAWNARYGLWYHATVLDREPTTGRVLVHYTGYGRRCDEWVEAHYVLFGAPALSQSLPSDTHPPSNSHNRLGVARPPSPSGDLLAPTGI